jgi:hypothetical protein
MSTNTPSWIVTAKKEASSLLVEKSLARATMTPRQKKLIKWLSGPQANNLKPLDERISNIKRALAKWIKEAKSADNPAERNGAYFAVRGLRSALWLHEEALKHLN